MAKILVLHGPNLNLLGSREPEVYGSDTLNDINTKLASIAEEKHYLIDSLQSNSEHALIDTIHAAPANGSNFIIINPASFTHTSIAIRDALASIAIPFIEVHISNINARERFRRHSFLSDIAVGVICGLGTQGYEFAFQAAITYINNRAFHGYS